VPGGGVHVHVPQQRRHEEPRAQGPRQARAILRLPPLRQIVQQGRTVKLFCATGRTAKLFFATGRTVKLLFAPQQQQVTVKHDGQLSFSLQVLLYNREGQLSLYQVLLYNKKDSEAFLCKFYCTTGRTVKLFLQVLLYNKKDS
jgi:hypothetical protein